MNLSRCFNFSVYAAFGIICLLVLASFSQAAPIKERMAARIPAINDLKDKGIVGENNRGFLEYRIAEKVQEKLVAEENSDRLTVYQKIGSSQGAPAELVGKRRAKMIAESGVRGRWYQKADGSWYRK